MIDVGGVGRIFLDFRTLHAAELEQKVYILNAQEIRRRLLEDLETLEGKATALVPELKREASRTWQDYLQPT